MSGKSWFSVVFVMFVALVVAFSNVLITQIQVERQSRKICTIMTTLDEAYHQPPGPTTPVGKRLAAAVHEYRLSLGCK